MQYQSPQQFQEATVVCKANIYFDGKVVSHSLTLADGCHKTLGLIYPGVFKFNTEAPEKMEIIAGSCRVRIAGSGDWIGFPAGTWFEVPGHSFFEIEVADGIAEYVCSFC
jgi:purine/pyrimidine-nucleoside phosphorylase